MKTKILLFSTVFLACGTFLKAQIKEGTPDFTITGSSADYIQYANFDYKGTDSIYYIGAASGPVVIDGNDDDAAWVNSNTAVINKALNEAKAGDVLNMGEFPAGRTDLYGTFRAIWNESGVYMFFKVIDDHVRFQHPTEQWRNDAIEFYFSQEVASSSKLQLIIPAFVGTPAPGKPAAKAVEMGSSRSWSDPSYTVLNYNTDNWDSTLFYWAVKKTDVGYNVEVYMDKDIVTNGTSATNYGLGKTFGGDVNIDEADTVQTTVSDTDPTLVYDRERSLGLLSYSNQEYANANYYGWFKFVAGTSVPTSTKPASGAYYNENGVVLLNATAASVKIYNISGKLVAQGAKVSQISVAGLPKGVYFVNSDGVTTKFIIK